MPSKPSKITRLAILALIVYVLLVSSLFISVIRRSNREQLSFTAQSTPQPAAIDPTGIYLAEGGMAHLVIDRNATGTLIVENASLLPHDFTWKVTLEVQHLIITSHMTEARAKFQGYTPSKWESYYELLPSTTIPEDWDLIRFDWWLPTRTSRPASGELPLLKEPVCSYLHRLNDARITEYFNSVLDAYQKSDAEPDLGHFFELASGLLDSYPNDLHVRTLYLDALIRKGDYETLQAKLDESKTTYTRTNDPFLFYVFTRAESALTAHQLSEEERNAFTLTNQLLSPEADLATRFQHFPEILNYQDFARPVKSLIPLKFSMNLLEVQISAKVFHVGAIFLMLQGKREAALKILASLYHLGQLMNKGGTLINRLIGMAVRSIAAHGLEIYTLNCCETPEEFQQLWKTLEQLNLAEEEPTTAALFSLEPPHHLFIPEITGPNARGWLARHRVANAKFQLVRMAAAAKHRFVSQGSFPRNASEFAPLLPQGPPLDPFSTQPLKFLYSLDAFTCYSLGPDTTSNQATITYDPTNGTFSSGDIIVKAPYHREYPFPRNAVTAKSKDELLRLFPHGLPPDPFADTRGKPLGITNTTPVYVYSYGPDTGEPKTRQEDERYLPEVLYDPTNGTVSPGDLFIPIPSSPP